eukprot:TRINITY_DN31862_c0_g1_i2.p1 TRINITY_DN31862_c0_g1~~TRINITY_DN31862_c0_g1_i2.p1  ORF type:complete len:701 (-),score=129.64 TRINITY_DN31862_c0_g1_i2:143-2179(-)
MSVLRQQHLAAPSASMDELRAYLDETGGSTARTETEDGGAWLDSILGESIDELLGPSSSLQLPVRAASMASDDDCSSSAVPVSSRSGFADAIEDRAPGDFDNLRTLPAPSLVPFRQDRTPPPQAYRSIEKVDGTAVGSNTTTIALGTPVVCPSLDPTSCRPDRRVRGIGGFGDAQKAAPREISLYYHSHEKPMNEFLRMEGGSGMSVIVAEVAEDTKASRAGIKAGYALVKMNGRTEFKQLPGWQVRLLLDAPIALVFDPAPITPMSARCTEIRLNFSPREFLGVPKGKSLFGPKERGFIAEEVVFRRGVTSAYLELPGACAEEQRVVSTASVGAAAGTATGPQEASHEAEERSCDALSSEALEPVPRVPQAATMIAGSYQTGGEVSAVLSEAQRQRRATMPAKTDGIADGPPQRRRRDNGSLSTAAGITPRNQPMCWVAGVVCGGDACMAEEEDGLDGLLAMPQRTVGYPVARSTSALEGSRPATRGKGGSYNFVEMAHGDDWEQQWPPPPWVQEAIEQGASEAFSEGGGGGTAADSTEVGTGRSSSRGSHATSPSPQVAASGNSAFASSTLSSAASTLTWPCTNGWTPPAPKTSVWSRQFPEDGASPTVTFVCGRGAVDDDELQPQRRFRQQQPQKRFHPHCQEMQREQRQQQQLRSCASVPGTLSQSGWLFRRTL